MPKISALPEIALPSGDDAEVVIASKTNPTDTYKCYLGELVAQVNRLRMVPQASDLFSTSPSPFVTAAVGAGSIATIADETNHPGILRIAANGASTGATILFSSATAVLIGGGEVCEFVFRPQYLTDAVFRFGFRDAATPVDGVCFYYDAANKLKGETTNNSTQSRTGTSYTIVTSTWYRARLEVNSAANRVDFYLYDSATGTLLWTDNLTTNIPTATGRETGFGTQCGKSSTGSGANNMCDVDYMAYWNTKALTR